MTSHFLAQSPSSQGTFLDVTFATSQVNLLGTHPSAIRPLPETRVLATVLGSDRYPDQNPGFSHPAHNKTDSCRNAQSSPRSPASGARPNFHCNSLHERSKYTRRTLSLFNKTRQGSICLMLGRWAGAAAPIAQTPTWVIVETEHRNPNKSRVELGTDRNGASGGLFRIHGPQH